MIAAPATASAKDIVAIVATDFGDGLPDDALVEAVESIVSADTDSFIKTAAEVDGALRAGQHLTGDDATTQQIVSQLQGGVDAFYEGNTTAALDQIESGVERAISEPMLLALRPRLSETARNAMLLLPRLYSGEARFEDAGLATEQLVAAFPAARFSRQEHPPAVIDQVEQARTALAAAGKRVVLQPVLGESCVANINGAQILLPGEEIVPVASRGYGLTMTCARSGDEEAFAGPFLLTVNRTEYALPVTERVVDVLAAASAGDGIRLPEPRDQREHLGRAIATLVDADRVLFVGPGADGVVVVAVSRNGNQTAATMPPTTAAAEMQPLFDALERESPRGEVGIDTGFGWTYAEAPSYWVEYTVIGVGAATMITGGIFLGLAASQADVVEDCKLPGACTRATTQENLDLYGQNLFAGEMLMLVGGVAAAAGTTVLLVRMFTGEDATESSVASGHDFDVTVGPSAAVGTWRVRW